MFEHLKVDAGQCSPKKVLARENYRYYLYLVIIVFVLQAAEMWLYMVAVHVSDFCGMGKPTTLETAFSKRRLLVGIRPLGRPV